MTWPPQHHPFAFPPAFQQPPPPVHNNHAYSGGGPSSHGSATQLSAAYSSPVFSFTGPLLFRGINLPLPIPRNFSVLTEIFSLFLSTFSLSVNPFNISTVIAPTSPEIIPLPQNGTFQENLLQLVPFAPAANTTLYDECLQVAPLAIQFPESEDSVFEDFEVFDRPQTPVWPSPLTAEEEKAQLSVRRSPRLLRKAHSSYTPVVQKAQLTQFREGQPPKHKKKNFRPKEKAEDILKKVGPPTMEQARLVLDTAGVVFNTEVESLLMGAGIY